MARKQLLIRCLLVICLVLTLFSSILGGCSKTEPESVETVKVGILQSMTGPMAPYGSIFMAAMKFVVQMKNDAGGIKSLGGVKITVAEGDDGSDPVTASSEVERLINKEKVVAIMGPTAAAQVLAVVPLATRYEVPLVLLNVSSEIFNQGSRYVFTDLPSGEIVGAKQAEFIDWLSKKHGAPTASIAIATLSPSRSMDTQGLISRLNELGYSNIVLNESFPATVTDHTPLVMKLKKQNPDMVVYNGNVMDAVAFYSACHTLDYYPWLVANYASFGATSVRDQLNPEVAKMTIGRPNAFCAGNNVYSDAYTRVPSLKDFQDAFNQAHPGHKYDTSMVAIGAFVAKILIRAIENAGSTDSVEIANALRELHIEAPDSDLVFADQYPEFKMTDSGVPSSGICMAGQWPDDMTSPLEAIWPESVANKEPRIK
ncbi:MAG: ABC transporter substrate-binding protein [Dehalococcoidales bacterium]|nr:ABC transporter substrate-binding protein [Dehalococcoidales bacterium]